MLISGSLHELWKLGFPCVDSIFEDAASVTQVVITEKTTYAGINRL
jgi:hypothetical protein